MPDLYSAGIGLPYRGGMVETRTFVMNNRIFPRDLDSFPLNKLPRRENVHETDSAQQCRIAVADHVHDLGSILRGIDVNVQNNSYKEGLPIIRVA